MNIKLDENLGIRGKEILVNAGFEVATVAEQHMCSAGDDELIERCRLEKRVLVTLDKEFSNPLVYKPANYCGIAVIRLKAAPTPDNLYACVRLLVNGLKSNEIDGKLWIVQEKAIRVYRPDDATDWFVGEGIIEYELA